MLIIQIKKDQLTDLVTMQQDELKLPYNQYWIRKLNTKERGLLRLIRFQSGYRKGSSAFIASVAIARVGYWYQLKILEIERVII